MWHRTYFLHNCHWYHFKVYLSLPSDACYKLLNPIAMCRVKWLHFAGVNHSFERIFLVLLIKDTYKIQSRIPTIPSESFRGVPCFLQTNARIGPWIRSWPLLPVFFPFHNSLSSSYSLLCSLQFVTSLNKLQTQEQCFSRLLKFLPT
jgi:hypothetical protein